MRRLFLTTAILAALQSSAFAQADSAPVFRSIDPTMKTTKAAAPVAAPVAAHAISAAPSAAPTLAAPVVTPAALPSPVSHSGEVIDSVGSGAIPAVALEVVTENNISYLNGGISDEEVAQIEAQENNYNLRIQIVGSAAGEFVSDAKLVLKDAKGSVVSTVSDAGPYVYFRVPVGAYVVDVSTLSGAAKTLSVKIPENSAIKTIFRM